MKTIKKLTPALLVILGILCIISLFIAVLGTNVILQVIMAGLFTMSFVIMMALTLIY